MMPNECQIRVQNTAGEELTLEARFMDGTLGAAVVAPPNPQYGGTIDNLIVAEVVSGLRQAGAAGLTFNYRGVERSQGSLQDNTLEFAVADYTAALAELARRSPGPYFAAGYSFGAGVALLAARHAPAETAPAGVLLIAPPIGLLQAADLQAFAGKVFVLIGDDDEYAPIDQLKQVVGVRADATLVVLPGADHFFHYGGIGDIAPRVAERVRAWL
jgi:alpha/beta superfamily hydrolase